MDTVRVHVKLAALVVLAGIQVFALEFTVS